ncbi:hypothetical protein TNCV_741661 [Trichonephila clavipes]|nr:hypothetical protein TNCV_741661 [Trichonephila clavipes]
MFDPSSFTKPTPLAHADTSRDVLPRGGTSHVFPYPTYSLDLTPYDFYLFPSMKKHLQGRHFVSSEEVKVHRRRPYGRLRQMSSMYDFRSCMNTGRSVTSLKGTT